MDEVDKRAIAAITVFCPNLVKFGLINCEFTEIRGAVDEQGWGMMRSVIDRKLDFFVDSTMGHGHGNLAISYYQSTERRISRRRPYSTWK